MATRPTINGVAEPKQRRSRDSFAKVRSAVLQLLQERGNGQFSIAEVSAAAGLSVGTIYGRVSSKADLLRVVQNEEFDRLDAETRERVSAAGLGAATFEGSVTSVVTAYAELLRQNRELLSPFFLLGVEDPAIRDRGRQSGDAGQAVFVRAMLTAAEEHHVELAAARADWAFEVFYSLSVRYLGLGVAATVSPENDYDWNDVLGRLADTVHLILTSS